MSKQYIYALNKLWARGIFDEEQHPVTDEEYKQHLLNLQYGMGNRDESTGYSYTIHRLLNYYGDGYMLINPFIDTSIRQSLLSDTYINELWHRFNQKYWDKSVFILDNPIPDGESLPKESGRDFMAQVWQVIYNTKDRYEQLLQYYDSKKGLLMDKITSGTITKFNDTPQNEGEYIRKEYNTNITTTDSSTDVGTAMQRLSEIEKLYSDVYEQWVKEIGSYVIFY